MQSELVASQRMAAVGEIAAAVAHGIGNPLSSIRAAAQVAMLDTDTETVPQLTAGCRKIYKTSCNRSIAFKSACKALLNFATPMEPHATG